MSRYRVAAEIEKLCTILQNAGWFAQMDRTYVWFYPNSNLPVFLKVNTSDYYGFQSTLSPLPGLHRCFFIFVNFSNNLRVRFFVSAQSTNKMDNSRTDLQEFTINIKLKLAGLWTSVMFCYVYGDIFSFFLPTRLQNLMNGQSGIGATTPWGLVAFAVLMTLPSLMIFMSLALKAPLNRSLNLCLGVLFTAIMLLIGATTISEWKMFYTFLAAVEVLLTSLIVWHAWRWERQS